MRGWERQKREIFSYNLFHSAIKWRHNTKGLNNYGFGIVGVFLRVNEAKADVTPEPDFTLFDGEKVLFIEIKSGTNINEGHCDQMAEYNRLDLEDVENFLHNTRLQNHSPGSVETFEHCIIYFRDFIEDCRNKWKNCKQRLEELAEETVVLSQERGNQLQLEEGRFSNEDLHSVFNGGLDLPPATDKTIYLTENIEHEALSYSICNDLVINNLQNGQFSLTPSLVRSFYGREMSLGKVQTCLDYLTDVGACRKDPEEDNKYNFVKADIEDIVGIEDNLSTQTVKEYLEDRDPVQSGLTDFI